MQKEIKFGVWRINEEGIVCDGMMSLNGGLALADYPIYKDSLDDKQPDNENIYEWPIYILSKMDPEDEQHISTFNNAFVFALDHFGIGFSPRMSIAKTFLRQQRAWKLSCDFSKEIAENRKASVV